MSTEHKDKSAFSRITFRSLFRGFFTSTLGAAPQGGIRLATYEASKSYLLEKQGYESVFICSSLSAIAGDLSSSIVKIPREVITQKLQTNMYSNSFSAFKDILRSEGIRGLFAGGLTTSLRDIPFMVILFTCYDEMKKYGASQSGNLSLLQSTIFGGLSGALAGYLTTPMDVLKTRIMLSKDMSQRNISSMTYLLKHEAPGLRAFFKGSITRSIWWFCVCSIFFPTYESGKIILKDKISSLSL